MKKNTSTLIKNGFRDSSSLKLLKTEEVKSQLDQFEVNVQRNLNQIDNELTDLKSMTVNLDVNLEALLKILKISKEDFNTVANAIWEERKETLEKAADNKAGIENVDRDLQSGDLAYVSFIGSSDGVAIDKASSGGIAPIWLGQNKLIPELEKGIIGMKKGEVRNVDIIFSDEYQIKDVAGKKVTFEVTLHNIKAKIVKE